jgi:hypothetical protein
MRFSWNTDRIVSLMAMVVGVGSLFIILYQTKLMREQQRASVLPYLAIALQSTDRSTYLVVRNTGIGPARLEDVRVRYKGKEFVGDPYDFFVAQHPDKTAASVDQLIPGRLVPAGESIQTLGAEGEQHGQMLKDLIQLFVIAEVPKTWLASLGADRPASDKALIEITYSSVYGERWRLQSDRFVPVALP